RPVPKGRAQARPFIFDRRLTERELLSRRLDAARESKRRRSNSPWRKSYVAAVRDGRRAVLASFVSPFAENGSDELMKHECVHQHSRFAMRPRISSAFSENQAF